MLRTAIVVSKALTPGEVANAVAIIMGQLTKQMPSLYGEEELLDLDGVKHAAISYNVVILQARPAQLEKFIESARTSLLAYTTFGKTGRSLSNSYDEYTKLVTTSHSPDLQIIAAGVSGDDASVRAASQGLSVYTA